MSRHTDVLTARRGLPAAIPVTAAPNFSMFANAHAAFWTLVSGLWSLDSGLWTLVSGLWSLDSGLWSLVSGLWTLDSGLWSLDSGLWTLVSGLWSLVSGLWSLVSGLLIARAVPDVTSPWQNSNMRDGSAELAERACWPRQPGRLSSPKKKSNS
jgi:hypothetical protein